jgi:hypothetical protein
MKQIGDYIKRIGNKKKPCNKEQNKFQIAFYPCRPADSKASNNVRNDSEK